VSTCAAPEGCGAKEGGARGTVGGSEAESESPAAKSTRTSVARTTYQMTRTRSASRACAADGPSLPPASGAVRLQQRHQLCSSVSLYLGLSVGGLLGCLALVPLVSCSSALLLVPLLLLKLGNLAGDLGLEGGIGCLL
jgi:hypothetical protein